MYSVVDIYLIWLFFCLCKLTQNNQHTITHTVYIHMHLHSHVYMPKPMFTFKHADITCAHQAAYKYMTFQPNLIYLQCSYYHVLQLNPQFNYILINLILKEIYFKWCNLARIYSWKEGSQNTFVSLSLYQSGSNLMLNTVPQLVDHLILSCFDLVMYNFHVAHRKNYWNHCRTDLETKRNIDNVFIYIKKQYSIFFNQWHGTTTVWKNH